MILASRNVYAKPLLLPVRSGGRAHACAKKDALALTLPPIPHEFEIEDFEELSGIVVMRWLNRISPYNDWVTWYGEVSEALAGAAALDPLWAKPHGPIVTAAVLTALAHTTSHFEPNRIGHGGRAFGLFQIRVDDPHADATVFQLPRSAAFAAIEILRASQSEKADEGSLFEMLSWYDGDWLPPFAVEANASARLDLAKFLLTDGGRLT